jgi:hypothetical protein
MTGFLTNAGDLSRWTKVQLSRVGLTGTLRPGIFRAEARHETDSCYAEALALERVEQPRGKPKAEPTPKKD